MLVMLAPSFDGSSDAYARLAQATDMLPYDLKSRVQPGAWSVLRALADEEESIALTSRLRAEGFPVFVVSREVAHDPSRRIVTLRSLELRDDALVLYLREREMVIPFGALTCIVRGEVHTGHVPARSVTPSSSTFRAVVPSTSDLQMFREPVSASAFDEFAAADLHFATVLWAARLDARSFDFSRFGLTSESPASDLDELVDTLAKRASVRVDRGVRTSSVVSVLTQASVPSSPLTKQSASDERFDPYSRVIAEAERLLSQSLKVA